MIVYLGVLLDFIVGDPKGFPHPVIFIGKLISRYEKLFYHEKGKIWGFLFTAAVLLTVGGGLWLLMKVCALNTIVYAVVSVLLIAMALAWRSLKKETKAVITAVDSGDLPAARRLVSYVVGRDTEELTAEEIIKADIETVAENTIDGVLAPLFYLFLGYFCGWAVVFIWLYKTINTLDSMVGYKNEKYADFGYCAAKLDDVVNFIPARLGAVVMLLAGVLTGCDGKNGWRVFRRDRFAHTSPNSAQSESVIAGLLGLELGGEHRYFGVAVAKPTIGDALAPADSAAYFKSCRVLDVSVILFMLLFTAAFLLFR